MRKVRGSTIAIAAGSAALAGLLLAACQNYGQPKTLADASGAEAIPDKPDYSWDVRPILSQNCFQCHGNDPKNRKAGLRLDIGEGGSFEKLKDEPGKRAIVPGNPKKSVAFLRMSSKDPDFRMPPRDAHKTVSPRDIAIIERWIKQGAKYKPHWAYIPVKEVKPQKTEWDKQANNEIDRYIFAELKKQGLSPSKEADKETLINRVTLDLTGLPPTLQEVDAFVKDTRPDAYERLVDRLLNTTEYAERQANQWMDVARYADTGGGLNDNEQSIAFPYRDWVISAFKRNIPYDKFVTWQLAGDKLPNPTREQILATSFIRAGKKNTEGGAIDEEFRVEYVNERAELVGKAFLGLTVGCAKCHDHKYDVISQADYYSMGGFFNSMDERGQQGFARGTPGGGTLEWPTAMQKANWDKAKGVTAQKEAAYKAALQKALAAAAPKIDAIPAAQRAGFLKAAIDADTQAYYPLDSGYKGDIEALKINEQPVSPGVPGADEKMTKTRAEVQAEIKAKIRKRIELNKKLVALGRDPIPDPEPPVTFGFQGPPDGLDIKKNREEAARRRVATEALVERLSKELANVPMPAEGAKPAAKVVKTSAAKSEKVIGRGADGGISVNKDGMPTRQPAGGTEGAMTPVTVVAPKIDPQLPRLASREVDKALSELIAEGYTDDRLGDPQRIKKRMLPIGLKEDQVEWTASGIQGAKPGVVNNVKFVPGAKGQGVLLHNSVGFAAKGVGDFERTDPYTLDFWVKLRDKDYVTDTRPEGPDASILYTTSGVNGNGYEVSLNNGHLEFQITHTAPHDQIKIADTKNLPKNSWQHITVTYDGNSKAAGTKLYVNGAPRNVEVVQDNLTRSARGRGGFSEFGSYFGLSFGVNFNRQELVDGALDELRVMTRALTPVEVAYLHNASSLNGEKADQVRAQMIQIAAQKDPAVQQAWKELTEARLAEQRVETPIHRLMVAADTLKPRTNYVLDRGVYNAYKEEVPTQAVPRVYKWDAKLPRNRLGLAQWLFDPKNPMTSRVFVNRLWASHFGTGIVQTVEDFGTQGSNPTHPELLDYLSAEFIRSGWDMKHMHKLMVMSATYRQDSTVSKDVLEKDPKNFYLARGPRYRMSAEQLRDTALAASGLLVKKVGGDSVFPYQPEGIWDGAAQGFVVYPTNVPDDQLHRRSMYTFVKRNAPIANLSVFDLPDRNLSAVSRTMSNTPLQGLVLLNDPQFVEAYRKVSERAIKSSANEDQQLTTMFRLATRRHPNAKELQHMKAFLAEETQRLGRTPEDVNKMLKVGVAPIDSSIAPVKLAAMTVVTAGVFNTPAAYNLR